MLNSLPEMFESSSCSLSLLGIVKVYFRHPIKSVVVHHCALFFPYSNGCCSLFLSLFSVYFLWRSLLPNHLFVFNFFYYYYWVFSYFLKNLEYKSFFRYVTCKYFLQISSNSFWPYEVQFIFFFFFLNSVRFWCYI